MLTCFYVHACMVLQFSREYDIEVVLASKQGKRADELQVFTQIWFH